MNHPDLFTTAPRVTESALTKPPVARKTDPDTSKAAAASMREAATAQRARILDILEAHGPLTNDEVDALCGWRTGTTSRRMTELLRTFQVVRLDATRRTEAGRAAHLHDIAR